MRSRFNLPRRNHRRATSFIALAMLSLIACLIAVACDQSPSARIGEQFTLGDFTFTITGRKSQSQFVVGEAIDAGHDATFIIVGLEIINNGKTTSAIAASSLELETPQGARYRPDTVGMAARTALDQMGGGTLESDAHGAILRPRIPTPFTVVFRVPYPIARGNLYLGVHEPAWIFGREAVIALQ